MRRLFPLLMLCFPLMAKGERVVVGAIGDFGVAALGASSAAIELSVANLVKRWDPDFIVTVGDNSYPDGATTAILDQNIGQFYSEYIHPYAGAYGPGGLTNRFFPALGNHEWPATASLAYFALPGNERYYAYRAGPVEFFIINSNPDPDGTTSTSIQGRWLQTQMSNSTAPWKLVLLHHPPYSADRNGAGNPGFRWPFAACGATAVFSGHDHHYARIHTNGIRYFINGLGGAAIAGFGSTNSAAEVRYSSDYGAMRLEATESNLVCHFVSRTHLVVDTFVFGAAAAGPFILGPPMDQTVIMGRAANFDVRASGAGTLRYQWERNGASIANATNRTFSVSNVQLAQEGNYRVLVISGTASNYSREARLAVARQPLILQGPTNVVTIPGQDAAFQVVADGVGPLRYQWSHGGVDLMGATNAMLELPDVKLEQAGEYRVRVSDELGAASTGAILTVRMRPVVTIHPVSQSAAVGETVVLSAEAVGTLPLSFGWRYNRRVITNIIVNGSVSFFTLRDIQMTNAGNYQVGVTNIAGIASGGLSSNAVITVLADGDGDRMPDDWERAHSFLPGDASDAAIDADGDGRSNLEEYLTGTDPTSAADVLKIDVTDQMIAFQAASNRTYAVEYCERLGSGSWQLLRFFTAATTNRTLSVRNCAPGFYRVVTPSSEID